MKPAIETPLRLPLAFCGLKIFHYANELSPGIALWKDPQAAANPSSLTTPSRKNNPSDEYLPEKQFAENKKIFFWPDSPTSDK
jgi:hypothetical protein